MRELAAIDLSDLDHVTGGNSARSTLVRATIRTVFEGAQMIGRSQYSPTKWPGVFFMRGKFMSGGKTISYAGDVNNVGGPWTTEVYLRNPPMDIIGIGRR